MENSINFFETFPQYGHTFRLHLGTRPNLVVSSAPGYEAVLGNTRLTSKGHDYKFLTPWLGEGLLTSSGRKWQTRRKLLTPAFHGEILKQFVSRMSDHAKILCDKFAKSDNPCSNLTKGNKCIYSHLPTSLTVSDISLCTLDIICDTVMGQHVGAQHNSSSPYVRSVVKITDIIYHRSQIVTSIFLQVFFLSDISLMKKY